MKMLTGVRISMVGTSGARNTAIATQVSPMIASAAGLPRSGLASLIVVAIKQAGGGRGKPREQMAHRGQILGPLVDHAKADHEQGRAADEREQRHACAEHAMKAHADRHGKIHHIAARQELAEPEQIGEFGGRQPFAPLDDPMPRVGQRTAERTQSEAEKADEQIAQANRRHSLQRRFGIGFGAHCGLQHGVSADRHA